MDWALLLLVYSQLMVTPQAQRYNETYTYAEKVSLLYHFALLKLRTLKYNRTRNALHYHIGHLGMVSLL